MAHISTNESWKQFYVIVRYKLKMFKGAQIDKWRNSLLKKEIKI